MAIKLKRFSDDTIWYVGSEFNPIGPGGYSVLKESTYKKKLDEAKNTIGKFGRLQVKALESFEKFDNKQAAIDRKIELQINKYGKSASLTPSQRSRAEELGLL